MNIAQFEMTVQDIVGDKYYALVREDYRRRGKRVVTWHVYTEASGWVGVSDKGNDPNAVLAELRKVHGVKHVA
jgi:hypothetical protein